jgi:hypothetical protein
LRRSAVGNTSTNGANCAERLPIILELIGSINTSVSQEQSPSITSALLVTRAARPTARGEMNIGAD